MFRLLLPSTASEIAAHSVAVAVAFSIITFLHIVLGELAPKTLALERAEKVALFVARPMEVFYKTFKAVWGSTFRTGAAAAGLKPRLST